MGGEIHSAWEPEDLPYPASPPKKNPNKKRFCPSESYESTDLCLDELGSHVKVSWLFIVFFKLHKGREWWATFKQPTTHTPNHLGNEIRPKKRKAGCRFLVSQKMSELNGREQVR